MQITIEGSARHVHVTKEALAVLFGADAVLHNKRELSQPGQYLCEERVRLEGPRGSIDRVSILGPTRPASQAEVSFTDARALGIDPPIRESGDLKGSAPIRMVGPKGAVDLPEGAIVAKRHIHLTPEEATAYGVTDKQIVSVKTEGPRALVYGEVVVRVSEKFSASVHLDFDEMNAAGLSGEAAGKLINN